MLGGHDDRVTRVPAPNAALRAPEVPQLPAPRASQSAVPAQGRPATRAAAEPAVADRTAVAAQTAGTGQSGDPALAQWWRRLLAFLIDSVILTLATGALWGRLLASFANRLSQAADLHARHAPAAHGAYARVFGHTVGPYLIVLVPTIILAITYYWLLTGYWGTTIGKRALGTWVVTAAGRSRPSLRRSFVRALVFVLGGEIVPLFFGIDNLWLLGDSRRQTLHDKAAGTLVVTRPSQPNSSG
jgi:uncharacterized RDD family membrane protein YckC